MDPCPSTFTLDDLEIHGEGPGEASASIASHVRSCPRCHARMAGRDRLRLRFEREVAGPLWKQIVARPRRRGRWQLGFFSLGLAVAAVALWLGSAPQPYLGAKGPPAVEIQVLARRHGAAFAAGATNPVAPGDELQFTVRATEPAALHVLLGSVDSSGRLSPFYPGTLDGRSVPLPPAGLPLSPPIVLDDTPGPERILVVVSARPLSMRAIAQVAEAAADRLQPFVVPGEPDARVRWLVVRKERGSF